MITAPTAYIINAAGGHLSHVTEDSHTASYIRNVLEMKTVGDYQQAARAFGYGTHS
jgi:hypothetical protein